MAKSKTKKNKKQGDAGYFLKILLYFIIGAVWIRTSKDLILGVNGFPIGLVIGVIFASHDHFQIDRKIEYVTLLIAMVLSYIAPVGIVLAL